MTEPCWICGKLDCFPTEEASARQVAAFEALRQLDMERGIDE